MEWRQAVTVSEVEFCPTAAVAHFGIPHQIRCSQRLSVAFLREVIGTLGG